MADRFRGLGVRAVASCGIVLQERQFDIAHHDVRFDATFHRSDMCFSTRSSGVTAMVLTSLLPMGLMQAWASVEYGTWYARSSEFLRTPTMNTWSRP